jgi:hypothetical protein
MGKYSIRHRSFFEKDQEFRDDFKPLLDAYDDASRMTALRASYAVQEGTLKAMRKAQWCEAVTQTIERFLCVCIGEGKFELPEPPEFEG